MVTASWQRVGFGPSARGLCVLLIAAAAVGCKSGSSWTAKPSWWTFGGSGDDPAKLAAAPPAITDVTKPSAAAKPYPTTTTPEGYVMESAQRAGQGQVASAAPQVPTTPAAEPAAVTYGSKPVTPAPASPPPQVASAFSGAGNLSGIAPQVGPYGAPPTAAPLEQTLPSAASGGALGSSSSAMPPAAYAAAPQAPAADPAGVRMADARGADSWASAPPAPPAAIGDSRYGASTGSRFSGAATPPPQAAAAPASAFPPITPPPPATLPGAADPLAAPAVGPTAAPSSLAPPTPTRRPDPGYRPGGTSSYRPSRTILAGDTPREPGAIQPVSFEMPANEGL
jgi:hypothetical protein